MLSFQILQKRKGRIVFSRCELGISGPGNAKELIISILQDKISIINDLHTFS